MLAPPSPLSVSYSLEFDFMSASSPAPTAGGDLAEDKGIAFEGFSRVSPFVRAQPSDAYLDRHYGIVSSTAPFALSPQESLVSGVLGVAVDLVDKHLGLWKAVMPSRPAERAVGALSVARSTLAALYDALRAHSVLRMCAVLYGRDMSSLADAFSAPPQSCESEHALALRACVDVDKAQFERHFSRAVTGIRLWLTHEERQLHGEHNEQETDAGAAVAPTPPP
nr:hypothetical protein [Pandoravirus massiliensis]